MKERGHPLRQLVLLLALLLMIGSALTGFADEADPSDKEHVSANNQSSSESTGLADPPPAGFSVLYLFTGVANEVSGGLDEATVVHCTNFGSEATNVQVQVFSSNGGTPYAGVTTVQAGHTRTFSTQPTAAFGDNVILAPTVPNTFQGSGRILVQQHSQVICTAQLLDADLDPPTYVARLPLFTSDGYHVGRIRALFLPLVLK